MHFMPDTEDQDSAAETFWPEGYKQVIRKDVPPKVRKELMQEKPFESAYQKGYQDTFSNHEQFLDKIVTMVAIGAENGADDAFDDVIDSFLKESPLPQLRCYAHYLHPLALSEDSKGKLRQLIINEYSQDNIYIHAYRVGYQKTFTTFEDYMNRVADVVITGTMNGANTTLETIYRSFLRLSPLIPVRRRPRRLKVW